MTQSESPQQSPFEILGVDCDADDRQVRRAYAAKIREARESGEAETVRRIQDAFEAIRDADARSQARKMWENRSAIEPLLGQGEAAVERGDLEEALGRFLQALELIPDSAGILGRVASLELSLLKVDDALRHVISLVRLDPSQGSSYVFLAHTLATRARLEPSPDEGERFWNKAWSAVRRARALGVADTSVVLLESQVLWNRSQPEQARGVVAVALDGCRELRSSELQLFLALLRMDALTGHQEGVTHALGTLRALLPEEEARRGSVLEALCDFAMQVKILGPKVAVACHELAKESYPESEWIDKEIRSCKALDNSRRTPLRLRPAAPRSLPRERRAPATSSRSYSSTSSGGWTGTIITFFVFMFLFRMCHRLVKDSETWQDRRRGSVPSRGYESRRDSGAQPWEGYDPTRSRPTPDLPGIRTDSSGKVELPYGVEGVPSMHPKDPRRVVPSTRSPPRTGIPGSSPGWGGRATRPPGSSSRPSGMGRPPVP